MRDSEKFEDFIKTAFISSEYGDKMVNLDFEWLEDAFHQILNMGWDAGYSDGHGAGSDRGYNLGHVDGYDEGVIDGRESIND